MTADPRPSRSTDAGPAARPPSGDAGSTARLSPRSPRAALQPESVPEPQRPSRRARHPIVVAGSAIFTIVLLLAAVAAFGLAAGLQRFEAPGPLDQSKIVNIPRNLGPRDIADLLQREGVIDQRWVFLGGVLAQKAWYKLKAGEYEFKRQATLRDVVDTIVEGKAYEHQLTIPEGLTSEQIVTRLMDNEVLSGNIKDVPKEGSILPETYKFVRGTTREQLIQQMQQAQRRMIQEVWDHRAPDLPFKSADQVVILASMIEREAGKTDERTRIAAVFINRLKLRMRLQSDPTIIYGLVGGKGTLGRPILRSEIDQPTPYNTYVIDGLPPGPIANPGRASLEAAVNPARTKELYFVADGTGGHVFAETLEQHQKNVARFRQFEQQQRGDGHELQLQSVPSSPPPKPGAQGALGAPGPKPRNSHPSQGQGGPRRGNDPLTGEAQPAARTQ